MKKHLPLFLLLFVFAGFVSAQGPASTANWFGYILPPSPAEYKYVSFTMQDLGSVSVASDEHPAVSTATFAEGYVWSVNNDNGNNICRSEFDAANNHIGAPEIMVGFYEFIEDCTEVPEVTPVAPTVYPNPTHGLIKVEAEGIHSVSIFKTLGQKVFESTVDGDAFGYNFSDQASGVYIIKVETAKGVSTKRVMVR